MKKLHLLSTLALGLACASCTDNSVDWLQVENHFLDGLQGKETSFTTQQTLAKEDIAEYQAQVWSAWRNANHKFVEDTLSTLTPLADKKDYKWPLPENLEPNAIMPFYWGTKGDKPAEGWPLYLYIHGSGPKEHEWSASYKYANKFEDAPCAYFIPQIPNEGKYYRWWHKSKLFAWERLIRQTFASENFDHNRFFVFGISEGGYGSQRLASYYADYLAAAGPMAGGEPANEAPAENCGHIGFSLRTGAEDYMFIRDQLATQAKIAFDSLENKYPGEFRHWIEIIPGYAHHIDYLPTPPWLRKFVRTLHPKHFIWVDYSLDGQFRKGFYNIAVRQRATEENSLRTRYEMTVKDNVVDLQVNKVVFKATSKEPKWGIPITFDRIYSSADKGAITLFLNNDLVDLDKEVTVMVNGKELFKGKVTPTLQAMVSSTECFFDPERVYPVAVDLQW